LKPHAVRISLQFVNKKSFPLFCMSVLYILIIIPKLATEKMNSSSTMTLDAAMDFTMLAGKYEGITVGELVTSSVGYGYLQYLSTLDELTLDKETLDAVNMSLKFIKSPGWSLQEALPYVLPYGKHKGEALVELCNTWEGRDYLEYMVRQEKPSEVREACKAVLDGTEPMEMSLKHALACRMPYGHYQGQSLEDIQRSYAGRKYLEWAKTTCRSSEMKCALKRIFKTIDEEKDMLVPTAEDEKDRLRYGRYKGKCLKELSKSKGGREWMKAMIKAQRTKGQEEKEFLYWLSRD